MGKQRTTNNITKPLTFNGFVLGDAVKVQRIIAFHNYVESPPPVKYAFYLAKYNLIPGQRRRF
jgi:hypothetical protein